MMIRNSVIVLILMLSIQACKSVSSLPSYPLAFYEVEAKGSPPQMMVRMVSDYSSIAPNQEFKIGFFFRIKDGWYTYTDRISKDNIPTEIILKIPDGFEILNEYWPEPTVVTGKVQNEKEIVYDRDFIIIYTIKAAERLSKVVTISAAGRWQICQGSLCTLGGAQVELELQSGKKRKSKLYKLLN